MNIQIKHYGTVLNGRKTYFNQPLYDSQLQALEGKQFCEVITPIHKKPSVSQYNYYRGGILPTCYQSEMFCHLDNKDEVHELYFAPKFLTFKKLAVIAGKQVEVTKIRSLADLSQDEMREFITKVKIDCEMNGIVCGEPQDYFNKFYNK